MELWGSAMPGRPPVSGVTLCCSQAYSLQVGLTISRPGPQPSWFISSLLLCPAGLTQTGEGCLPTISREQQGLHSKKPSWQVRALPPHVLELARVFVGRQRVWSSVLWACLHSKGLSIRVGFLYLRDPADNGDIAISAFLCILWKALQSTEDKSSLATRIPWSARAHG